MQFPGSVRAQAWRGFAFDSCARTVSEHLMLQSGEWSWGPRAWDVLERGGVSPEGRSALERGGVSPEGASSPRARRSLARGGVQPSSEAEFHPRGRPALERGGVSPEGASSPRARQSFTQGGVRLAGHWGCLGRGLLSRTEP
jgi:hypothetical protein